MFNHKLRHGLTCWFGLGSRTGEVAWLDESRMDTGHVEIMEAARWMMHTSGQVYDTAYHLDCL